MADLLSAQDHLDIAAAIQDVKDTFFDLDIIIEHRRSKQLVRFKEKRDDGLATCSIPVKGLYIPDKTDTDAEAMRRPQGSIDLSEGVVYIGYAEAQAATPSLIDKEGAPDIIPNKDTLVIFGKRVTITGVNLIAPNQGTFHLVKIHYHNELAS